MNGSGKGQGTTTSAPLTALQQDGSIGLTPQATGYVAQDTSQYPIRTQGANDLGYLPGSEGQPPIVSPEYTQTAYTGMATAGAKDYVKGASQGLSDWARSPSHLSQGGGSIGGLPGIDQFIHPPVRPSPAFPLTPGQSKILRRLGIPDKQAQSFISNQILSGNAAYGPYTSQQIAAARMLAGGYAAAPAATE